MLLYFQQAAESGDLEQAAQNLAQSQLPTEEAPLPDGQTGLEGSQESFPQGALPGGIFPSGKRCWGAHAVFQPGGQRGGGGFHRRPGACGNSAPARGDSQEGGSSLDMSQGLESVSLEQLYQVIPLLAYVPQEGLQQAQEQAAASDSMMGEQVGVTLARLFYEELGMDTAAIQSQYIWNKGLQMLGVALLGVIATVWWAFSPRGGAAVAASCATICSPRWRSSPTGSLTGSPPPP